LAEKFFLVLRTISGNIQWNLYILYWSKFYKGFHEINYKIWRAKILTQPKLKLHLSNNSTLNPALHSAEQA
jgi:hypothetical protein